MEIGRLLTLSLVVAIAACGDSESDSLSLYPRAAGEGPSAGPSASSATTDASGDGGGGSGPSSTAPTSSADGGVGAGGDGGTGGRALFEALLPAFDTTCGGACHQQGGAGAPAYLGGADPYTTIKTYQGMIAPTAAQSILLTKGQHEGPALTGSLETSITNWLTVEASALGASGPPETGPLTITSGANTVDLSKLGITGASLGFTAAITSGIVTMSALEMTAPASTGMQVTYPIFYINGSGGAQTENDDLSNVSQAFAAGTSAPLGTGILILTGWATGDTLQIAFTQLAPATVSDDAGAPGGCKSVATFTADAVPAIQANTCLNCHNTGGSGNAALDLSALAATPVDDATACAQALTRINTATPAQSDIILAPTGQVAMHPFKNASASFVTMMETWIAAEK